MGGFGPRHIGGEHVYHRQLVYRLLRIGLKLRKVDHHSMSHTSISVMGTNFVISQAFGGVDAQKQGQSPSKETIKKEEGL